MGRACHPGLHQLGQAPDGGEVLDDLLPHLPNAGAQARDLCGEFPLERHRKRIKMHRKRREQAHGKEAFQDVEGGLLEVPSACGVLYGALEGGDHHADGEERPA